MRGPEETFQRSLKSHMKRCNVVPDETSPDRRYLLGDLLRAVSRSFYLTLRVLPKALREPVGLAYLLARAADTITDTRLLSPEERLVHLLSFRREIQGPAHLEELREIEKALAESQELPVEGELLTCLPEAFKLLEACSEPNRAMIRSLVVTLTQGMEMDLTTFPGEESGRIVALEDAAALERYVYYVAGCVGEFWTEITIAHVPALRAWDETRMAQTGVEFGKALQLTNVLRDVPKDLRLGRCYLPQAELSEVGLTPDHLKNPSSGAAARPVLVHWIKRALEHYAAAEQYLLAIPRRCLRLRLAVLWPILIGLASLHRLAQNPSWLDPERPAKVSRRWVYQTLALSAPCGSSNQVLHVWISHLRKKVEAAL